MKSIGELSVEASTMRAIVEAELKAAKGRVKLQAKKYVSSNELILIEHIENDIKKAMAKGENHTYFSVYDFTKKYCNDNNMVDDYDKRHYLSDWFQNEVELQLIEILEKKGYRFTYVKSNYSDHWSIHIFWNRPSYIGRLILSSLDDYKKHLIVGAAAVLIFAVIFLQ